MVALKKVDALCPWDCAELKVREAFSPRQKKTLRGCRYKCQSLRVNLVNTFTGLHLRVKRDVGCKKA